MNLTTSKPSLAALSARALLGVWLGMALLSGVARGQAVKPAKAHAAKTAAAHQPPIKVEDAWVRVAVQGQMGTGGFMQLTAPADMKLLGLSSPVAGEAQLHEMVMDGDVMRMREAGPLALPAGQPVTLAPGAGHRHLMLMDLKHPLKVGDQVKLVLKLQLPDGQKIEQTVMVPVKAAAPVAPAPASAAAPVMAH